jgi:hypothetical protein
LGIDKLGLVEEDDTVPEDEWEFRRQDPRKFSGRSAVTGY